jgi:hypothetical protein
MSKLPPAYSTGGAGGALYVRNDHIFASTSIRDDYFGSNPSQLIEGANIVTNGILQKYIGATWIDISIAVKGSTGIQGNQGIQGIAGPSVISVAIADGGFLFTNSNGSTFELVDAVAELKGEPGDNGNGIMVQYSADGVSGWSPTLISGTHKFWRWSTDGGLTYTAAERFTVSSGDVSVATSTQLGVIKSGDGFNIQPDGTLDYSIDSSLILTAGSLSINASNVDVFSFKNASTLTLGVFKDNIDSLTTANDIANASKGDWWLCNEATTLLGTSLSVGEQLWCTDSIVGVPTDLSSFAVVPFTLQQATSASFGSVRIGGTTPLAPTAIGTQGSSTAAARADHTHPQQVVPVAGDASGSDLGVATSGTSDKFSREDHVHQDIPVFTGATVSADGSTGRVPAPTIADKDKFLRGDSTWHGAVDIDLFDDKGSIVVATGASEVSSVPIGTQGQVLTVDTAEDSGVKWVTPSTGVAINDVGSSGYIDIGTVRIQWGIAPTASALRTITLPAPFKNTSYTVTANTNSNLTDPPQTSRVVMLGGKTANSFKGRVVQGNDGSSDFSFQWQAIGLKP